MTIQHRKDKLNRNNRTKCIKYLDVLYNKNMIAIRPYGRILSMMICTCLGMCA